MNDEDNDVREEMLLGSFLGLHHPRPLSLLTCSSQKSMAKPSQNTLASFTTTNHSGQRSVSQSANYSTLLLQFSFIHQVETVFAAAVILCAVQLDYAG